MIKKEIGYAYTDLTLVPAILSDVKSRSEVNCYDNNERLPIFTAPMSAVINETNYLEFENNNLYTVIPRSVDIKTRMDLINKDASLFSNMNYRFISMSLNEFKEYFCDEDKSKLNTGKKYNICIDIANGHMSYLYDLCLQAKKLAIVNKYTLIIMTGNIANPGTYDQIILNSVISNIKIIDYIRCGIGSGSACITSSNTSVHYPIASLIDECNTIKNKYINKDIDLDHSEMIPYIIADGGIRNYSDVIKALALGADYVMIGSLFAKCLESCGTKTFNNYKGEKETCSQESAAELYEKGAQLYTKFYGMASSDGQIAITGKKTKTAEGITKMIPVEYRLYKWIDNMKSYLKSAMSYCGCFCLDDFIGNQQLIVNSPAEISAVNK